MIAERSSDRWLTACNPKKALRDQIAVVLPRKIKDIWGMNTQKNAETKSEDGCDWSDRCCPGYGYWIPGDDCVFDQPTAHFWCPLNDPYEPPNPSRGCTLEWMNAPHWSRMGAFTCRSYAVTEICVPIMRIRGSLRSASNQDPHPNLRILGHPIVQPHTLFHKLIWKRIGWMWSGLK